MTGYVRISKKEFDLSNPNHFRRQTKSGSWSYWKITK